MQEVSNRDAMPDKPSRVVVLTPECKPQVIDLTGEPFHIGRSSKNDLFLDDLLVSRQHAMFYWENGDLWLSDLNSVNGTLLNDRHLSGSSRVQVGDRICIGQTMIKVESSPEAPSELAASDAQLKLMPETTLTLPSNSKTDTDLHLLLASIRTGTAGPEASPIDRTQKRLEVINEVGRALLKPSTLNEVLREIVYLVLDVIPAERAFLFLKNPADRELVCKVACYRQPGGITEIEPVAISRSVVDEVIGHGQPVFSCDTLEDKRFKNRQSIILSGVLSMMSVPLTREGKPMGILYVDNRSNKFCFSNADLELLTTVASLVDIKIENALLLEERLDHERMRQQLENARQIQLRLLPTEPVHLEGYDLAGLSIPCFAVGGDYYDFIPLASGRIAIVLADVAGKGMEAALLVSCLHACVRSQARTDSSLPEKMTAINRYLFENTPEAKFATLFYAELDPSSHILEWVNAGHNPSLLVKADGQMQELASIGFPVGMMEQAQYPAARVNLAAGDLLLLFSDGVIDASTADDNEFGMSRLVEATIENRLATPARLIELILQALNSFLKGGRANDDITLAMLKRPDK